MHDGLPWQARIGRRANPDDGVGAGVLIGARHVITCASVVGAALGLEPDSEAPPEGVPVALPMLPEPHRTWGRVVAWVPEAGLDPRWTVPGEPPPGIAVLELTEPAPAQATPALLELIEPDAYRERAIFCVGFPPDHPAGQRVHADCADADADTTTGLTTDHGSIDASFTGTGAWDPIRGSVLGLVVAAETTGSHGFLIPSHCLKAAWPQAPVHEDRGTKGHLLSWLAGMDTRRGNRWLRLSAGLAFAGLGVVWWFEPETPSAPPIVETAAATSAISGFVWERSGKPITGVSVLAPTRGQRSQTDQFGRFNLQFQEGPGDRVELIVMAPGYRSLAEVKQTGDSGVNLVLARDSLDDDGQGAAAEQPGEGANSLTGETQ
ncbi:MAG TPA: hypothetical protein VES73_06055 [Lamprocystis sp. (in: g-proteobacteria)]|nr:hypothetical protein [Lamprocystis sp. (in: g-proteobacteria)]